MVRVIKNRRLRNLLKKQGLRDVWLVKGAGYFYITSDNKAVADSISRLEHNMICCNSFSDQPVEHWVKDILDLLND